MNHHQIPLCDSLYANEDVNFSFYSTGAIANERLSLGYSQEIRDYHSLANYNDESFRMKVDFADVVIIGAAPMRIVKNRLLSNKLTFTYSERIFKNVRYIISNFIKGTIFKRFINPSKFSSSYLLCASSYMAHDMKIIGAYKNKMFKWGYFPKCNYKCINYRKNTGLIKIIWVGRLIKWKQPQHAIFVAAALKKNHINFDMEIIGDGPEMIRLKKMSKKLNVIDRCSFLGSLSNEDVLARMYDADVFLFTSNYSEGWGAVLNEAMGAYCCVIANKRAGATNYLIDDSKNGFIYNKWTEIVPIIEQLASDNDTLIKYKENASLTIEKIWNADLAARRLVAVSKCILNGTEENFESGPMSKIQ